jgi:hypothetical protein
MHRRAELQKPTEVIIFLQAIAESSQTSLP